MPEIVALVLITVLLCAGPRIGRAAARRLPGEAEEMCAERLLRDVLSPGEFTQLQSRGFLDVPSRLCRGRVYRIPRRKGLVGVCEQGIPTMALCLQPLERLPDADVVVIHKLMIEADEAGYLQTASQLGPTPGRIGPGLQKGWC